MQGCPPHQYIQSSYRPMPFRVKRLLAALWSACTSINVDACLKALIGIFGYALLGYGCYLHYRPLGFIVPGALIVLPRLYVGIRPLRRPQLQPVEERRRWTS